MRGTSTSALGNGAMGMVWIGLLTASEGNAIRCSSPVSVDTTLFSGTDSSDTATLCSWTDSGGTATLCSWTETGKVRRRSGTISFVGGGTTGAVLEGGREEEGEGT